VDKAVEIAVRETKTELEQNKWIEKVVFACFGDDVYTAYLKALGVKG
jgi:O-acetyl-ADP-ribose deacetylase (regulator of RNase III)